MANPWLTTITDTVAERTSCTITATITDATPPTGVAIPGSNLTTLTLTLTDLSTGTILNGRNNQNVLNANGGTVTSGGVLTLQLEALDNVLQTQTKGSETHDAVLRYTWNSGARAGIHIVRFVVANLEQV